MTPLRYNPLWQLTLARLREFGREPEAVFWVFVFPILLAVALGIAFRSKGPEVLAVGVQAGPNAEAAVGVLDRTPDLRARLLADSATAYAELRGGRVALVVVPGNPPTYWYDPTRQESRLAELLVNDALQQAGGRREVYAIRSREITERGSRYIDFLIPGLLGMNLMGTGMWGIGFSIVNARSKKLLKRLIATPMRRSHFLLGQMNGRLGFLIAEVVALLGFAHLAFDVPVRGSLVLIAGLAVLGAMTFAGMGLLVASRARTVEGVSGLMNLVMLPMWILSGNFFSTSRFPDAMQPLVQALPLTAVNDALRGVIIDGASLAAVSGEVALAAGWGIVSFAAALWLFKWR